MAPALGFGKKLCLSRAGKHPGDSPKRPKHLVLAAVDAGMLPISGPGICFNGRDSVLCSLENPWRTSDSRANGRCVIGT